MHDNAPDSKLVQQTGPTAARYVMGGGNEGQRFCACVKYATLKLIVNFMPEKLGVGRRRGFQYSNVCTCKKKKKDTLKIVTTTIILIII